LYLPTKGATQKASHGDSLVMDDLDKKLLDTIQNEIPINKRPFNKIADQLGIAEKEVLRRMKKLMENKIIRRVGGSFDSQKLGYRSVLIAVVVPDDKLDKIAAIINRYTGVTHNYRRDHTYNLWFTLTASSEKRIDELLEQMKKETGIVKMFPLPALKKYKIAVHFKMARESNDGGD
jgi:siroheme decarboxylase